MNERIKQLATQATREFSPVLEKDKWQEKFAELLIQECITQLHKRGIDGFGILEERNLKQHFGVE